MKVQVMPYKQDIEGELELHPDHILWI